MRTIWILLAISGGHVHTVSSQPYTTEQSCIKARDVIESGTVVKIICVSVKI